MAAPIPDGIWLQRMRMIAKCAIRFAALFAAGIGVFWTIQWAFYVFNSATATSPTGSGVSYHLNYFFAILGDFILAGLIVAFEPALTKWLVPNPGALCPACGYPYQPDNPPPQCTECGIALDPGGSTEGPYT